jgi:hypothetical protein
MRRVAFEYDSLLHQQNGQCAICKVDHRKSRLSIDHNHTTLELRGLLCHECNSGIAYFDENSHFLIYAAIYLLGGQSAKPFKISDDDPAFDFIYYGRLPKLRTQIGEHHGVPVSGTALAEGVELATGSQIIDQ